MAPARRSDLWALTPPHVRRHWRSITTGLNGVLGCTSHRNTTAPSEALMDQPEGFPPALVEELFVHITITAHVRTQRDRMPSAQVALDLSRILNRRAVTAGNGTGRGAARGLLRVRGVRQVLAASVAQAQAYARAPQDPCRPLHIAIGTQTLEDAEVTSYLLARRLRRRGHQLSLARG